MIPLLDEVLEAHGGLARWNEVSAVEAHVRFGGLAFRSRLCFGTSRWRAVRVDAREPRVEFDDYPRSSMRGLFHGDRVAWMRSDGVELRAREAARRSMATWRRQLFWDGLDLLYFAGYALWNYLTLPFLLAAPGVRCEQVAAPEPTRGLRSLQAVFPPEIPTHSPTQIFHFDESGRLRRHDYDPLPFASWARAAHLCSGYQTFGGVPVATRRRVVPRRPDGGHRSGPTLVWIEVKKVRWL